MSRRPDPYLDEPEGEERPGPRGRRGIAMAGVTALVLAGFGGLIWYAYNLGTQSGGDAVPVIAAPQQPYRKPPEDPGGAVVEHTDKEVYTAFETPGAKRRVERLLPPPEVPMAKPPPPPPPEIKVEVPPPSAAAPAPPPGATPAPAPPAAVQTAPAPAAPTPPAPLHAAPVHPAPAVKPPPVARPAPAPAATPAPGPVASLPPRLGAAGPVRVQFGAYRTEEEARQAWGKLKAQNADLLGRLNFMTETVQRADGAVLHRVQGGTLSDAVVAQLLCDQMKARKFDCIVVRR